MFTVWMAVALAQQASPAAFLATVNTTVNLPEPSKVRSLFANPADADYFIDMKARDRDAPITVHLGDAPKGWESFGKRWVVLSKHQDIEQDHDPIYPLLETPEGFKLGAEIKEFEPGRRAQPTSLTAWVNLRPSDHVAEIQSRLRVKKSTEDAILLRLNPAYELIGAGSIRRLGSILIWEPKATETELNLRYRVRLNRDSEDQIQPTHAYLTAFWTPSLSRLPCLTDVTISGPKDWQLRSEGVSVPVASWPFEKNPANQTVRYRCEVPISYPKVTGGAYVLAAETTDAGKFFKVWQFAPIDKKRADQTLENMVQARKELEEKLSPWPFPGYECFDGKNFYGIESYSYTILAPSISVRYVAHEMGHTYLGGLAPCAYVEDTWNEGVTTYVDDVLTGRLVDQPLRTAYASKNVPVALKDLSIAWSYNNLSYTRGAYVMAMLEREIGLNAVLTGLRSVVTEERGKNTTWASLRPHFEKATGGLDLGWFWNQWINNAKFPDVTLIDHQSADGKTYVNLSQSGTARPFRLKVELRFLEGSEIKARRVVSFSQAKEKLTIAGLGFSPSSVQIQPIPFTLARISRPE
jgi:hypothetical protein